MFFIGKVESRTAGVSDAVYMEVIATLYGTAIPILFVGIGHAVVGSIAARETGDSFTGVLTILGIIVALIRSVGVIAFRRRVSRQPSVNRAEAVAWEWRYAVGSGTTALILGLFAARSLTLDSAICSVMAIGIAFGFGAGVVSRLSLRPIVAIVGLSATGIPVIATAFLHQQDTPHIGLGILMTIYLVGSFEMVRLTYNATLNQMMLKQQFEQLARTDPMTGLLNRSVLATDFAQVVAGSGSAPVAVHAIDLDRFKAANDRFGHPVGDALLKQVAARLKAVAGPSDLLVRMGGDKFILVQKSARSRAEATSLAQQIFEQVGARYCVAGHEIVIGASIGIAMSPDDGTTVEALLSRSDHALYQAKERGGGFVFAGDFVPSTISADEVQPCQRAA